MELEGASANLRRVIAELEGARKTLQVTQEDIYMSAVGKLFDRITVEGSELLVTYGKSAIESCEEFNIDFFKTPFLNVLADKRAFNIILSSRTKEGIEVEINLDEIAGSIEQYAFSVVGAREDMDVSKKNKPDKASAYWRDHIYGRAGFYGSVMNARKNYWYSPAPFWYLIDHGNTNVRRFMPRREGGKGEPYPTNLPTRFVGNFRRAVKRAFQSMIRDEEERLKGLLEEKANIDSILGSLDQVLQGNVNPKEKIKGNPIYMEIELNKKKFFVYQDKGNVGITSRLRNREDE